jgi:uncharacterized membrane protein YccC
MDNRVVEEQVRRSHRIAGVLMLAAAASAVLIVVGPAPVLWAGLVLVCSFSAFMIAFRAQLKLRQDEAGSDG